MPTGLDFFDAFFGALCAGAVPVPLYPPVRLGRLEQYHAQTAAMLDAVGRPAGALGRRGCARLLGETVARTRGCRLQLLERALPGDDECVGRRPSTRTTLALVQFSSGTTVDPKPVALTHRALLAQVEALNRLWPDAAGRAAASPGCRSTTTWG